MEWRWNGSRQIALTWKELGGPTVERPSKVGFGRQLMGLCVASLGGTMLSEYQPDGFVCRISIRNKEL